MDAQTIAPVAEKERLSAIVQTILREPTAPFPEARAREVAFGDLIAYNRGGEDTPSAGPRHAFCARLETRFEQYQPSHSRDRQFPFDI